MKIKFIKILSAFLLSFGLIASMALPTFADNCTDICTCASVPDEVKKASGCAGTSDAELGNVIVAILKNIILTLGVVAAVFVVIGGVMYMTSSGDPGKIKKARDTILYAAIGLVVCALAFIIVNFVIGIITSSTATS